MSTVSTMEKKSKTASLLEKKKSRTTHAVESKKSKRISSASIRPLTYSEPSLLKYVLDFGKVKNVFIIKFMFAATIKRFNFEIGLIY